MEKRGKLNWVLSSFILNLIVGSVLAYLAYLISDNLIVSDYKDLAFLILVVLAYMFSSLFYGFNNLKWKLISKSKKTSYTFFFTMTLLFIQPFLTSALFSFLISGAENSTTFVLFIAELIAFVPLMLCYAIMSNYLKNSISNYFKELEKAKISEKAKATEKK